MQSEDALNSSISRSNKDWLEISLDSLTCVAGERLSGEILLQLQSNSKNLSISLRSKGVESIKIKESSGNLIEQSSNIYTLNTVITETVEHGKVQSIYPFTFKLPVFSPATFHFSDNDNEGNHITASVHYEIEAILYDENADLLKCKKKFYVLNRNARKVLSGEVSEDTVLNCCWCCTQGISTISLGYINNDHILCSGNKNYKINVKSAVNNKLESMVGQVFFEFLMQIPGGKAYTITKVLSRSVPEIRNLISSNQSTEDLSLEFEVDLSQVTFGENPCSNDCALFGVEYKIQFYAIYDIGCRSKRAVCEMPFHVNPVTLIKEEISLPSRWEPKENLIANLILEASNGIPYPQGTVLVNRNKN